MRKPEKISSSLLFGPIWNKSATLDFYSLNGVASRHAIFRVDAQPCAVIFATTAADEIILVRQYRPGAGRFIYELPGGLRDKGETPEACAARELLEETGYRAENIGQLYAPIYFEPVSLDFQFLPFLATGCRKVAKQKLDKTEDIEIKVIPVGMWAAGIQSGAIITDAKSIAITFLALGVKHLRDLCEKAAGK